MKVTNLVALLAAVLLTVAEFLVFEYDSRQNVRALSGRGPPVCLRRAGSLRRCPEWT